MTKRFVCQHCQTTYPDFDVAHVCSRGPYAPKLKLKKNERIRELLEQVGVKYVTMPDDTVYEKFAELIVAEMLQTCEDHPAWTGRMIGEEIKEHFGVEE
jgi:transposase